MDDRNIAEALEQRLDSWMNHGVTTIINATRNALPFPVVPQQRDGREGKTTWVLRQVTECEDPPLTTDSPGIRVLMQMLETAQTPAHVGRILAAFYESIRGQSALQTLLQNPARVKEVLSSTGVDQSDVPMELITLVGHLSLANFSASPLMCRIEKGAEHRVLMSLFLMGLFGAKLAMGSPVLEDDRTDRGLSIMANITKERPRIFPPEIRPEIDAKTHPSMMSRDQLLRFFQLPDLPRWLDEAFNPDRPASGALASTLDVAAECYAENEYLMDRNTITEDDVRKWMREKLAKRKPGYHVTLSQSNRLMWSEFARVAIDTVAPRLKEGLVAECATVPEVLPEAERGGDFFELLVALTDRLVSSPDTTFNQVAEVSHFIPFENELECQVKLDSEKSEKLQKAKDCRRKITEKLIELSNKLTVDELMLLLRNPDKVIRPSSAASLSLQGFEHMDDRSLIDLMTGLSLPCMEIFTAGAEKVFNRCSMDELIAFKAVIETNQFLKLNPVGVVFAEVCTARLARDAVHGESDEALRNLSEAQTDEDPGVQRIILATPADLRNLPFPGRPSDRELVAAGAESELAERYFANVRGGSDLIDFLRRNRRKMRIPELIAPFDDAVNRRIIEEYRDHRDLFALLEIATLMHYLGYPHAGILTKISHHARLAEMEYHPEMYPIGAEMEQANPDSKILGEHYGDVGNVCPIGGDWDAAHEITTARTHGPWLQKALLALISRHPEFMNIEEVWSEQRKGVRSNSVHLTMSVGAEFDHLGVPPNRILHELSNALNLAFGIRVGTNKQKSRYERGTVGDMAYSDGMWKWGSSQLASGDRLSRRLRMEEKSGALQEDGGHEEAADSLYYLGNAMLQDFLVSRGQGFTQGTFATRMAEIARGFKRDFRVISDPNRPFSDLTKSGDTLPLSAEVRECLRRHTSAAMQEASPRMAALLAMGTLIQPHREVIRRL